MRRYDARLMSNAAQANKAAIILGCITLAEWIWVYFELQTNTFSVFFRYLGFDRFTPLGSWGWIAALVVTVGWIWYCLHLPSVKKQMFRLSWLKVLALFLAIAAALCEETVFRKFLMDALDHAGYAILVQLLGSGALFGILHGIWGFFKKDFGSVFRIIWITGILGVGLGVVYLASGRNIVPCIMSHFFINLFVEPGLMLAAVNGEMQNSRNKTA